MNSLRLKEQWPSVPLNALAASGTGQARSLKSPEPHPHPRLNSHFISWLTSVYSWNFLPNTTRHKGHEPIPPNFMTLQYQLLNVYLQYCTIKLREETWGGEDPPVKTEEEEGRQQSRAATDWTVSEESMPTNWGKLKMGGNISQKKGSRRASTRSHANSVMWVKSLTC